VVIQIGSVVVVPKSKLTISSKDKKIYDEKEMSARARPSLECQAKLLAQSIVANVVGYLFSSMLTYALFEPPWVRCISLCKWVY
jgi:hypothetical protein